MPPNECRRPRLRNLAPNVSPLVLSDAATKAYHIEVVSDLTADSFIAALRRFVSRRGTPRYLFSDNGTNFVGAKRKLSELQTLLLSLNSNELILYLAENTMEWKMIPPASPHFGGLWASGIIKFHLKRTIGETKLTFEELTTLLTQTEAVLNSRPLSKTNHNDVGNLDALTPSHFLTGDVLTSIPEQDFSNIPKPTLLKPWELLQQMKQGDIVLIKEDNMPPGVWPLGRIAEIHPGKDGNVRVVTVKTVHGYGYFKRPIVKLLPLPLHRE
ncbi:uncharacterized protein LOC118203121 [Stegodyphus dumicola]|uniref:uncharacterized protein LOC118203121 n=1 Tax=Stegodyphus dumicola TaxID=202533 RepID=UPI0015AAFF44|nr:uncharacterized protein LOC118203121 [Stegodyphus dumicola]